jgi:hypothetical protein
MEGDKPVLDNPTIGTFMAETKQFGSFIHQLYLQYSVNPIKPIQLELPTPKSKTFVCKRK